MRQDGGRLVARKEKGRMIQGNDKDPDETGDSGYLSICKEREMQDETGARQESRGDIRRWRQTSWKERERQGDLEP